jgi:hypothetical protein
VNLISRKAVFSDIPLGAGSAAAELGNIGSDTLRIFNGAAGGIALSDGTGRYSFGQDASHNLRILGGGGTNVLDLTQGATPIALKMSSVGFYGTAPQTSKPLVAGSRGGNAALGSLLYELAQIGLITDSSTP